MFIKEGEEVNMLGEEWFVRGNVSSDEENDGRGASLSTGERKETCTELEEETRGRDGWNGKKRLEV